MKIFFMNNRTIGFNLDLGKEPEISAGDFVNVFLCQPPIILSGVYAGREGNEMLLRNVSGVYFKEDGTKVYRSSEFSQRIPLANVSSWIKTTAEDYRGRATHFERDLALEEIQREISWREAVLKLKQLRNQESQQTFS